MLWGPPKERMPIPSTTNLLPHPMAKPENHTYTPPPVMDEEVGLWGVVEGIGCGWKMDGIDEAGRVCCCGGDVCGGTARERSDRCCVDETITPPHPPTRFRRSHCIRQCVLLRGR